MECLEVLMARNAAASGISLEENYRLAKEGQFIIRHYPPAPKVATQVADAQEVFIPTCFQVFVGHQER